MLGRGRGCPVFCVGEDAGPLRRKFGAFGKNRIFGQFFALRGRFIARRSPTSRYFLHFFVKFFKKMRKKGRTTKKGQAKKTYIHPISYSLYHIFCTISSPFFVALPFLRIFLRVHAFLCMNFEIEHPKKDMYIYRKGCSQTKMLANSRKFQEIL